ncbi:NADP-dependent oxidoreductase [Actinoplanes sp. RD1]|uniref:NADP-dependent oxidoreductase n=1 Tax=Actinoplanes sp. RD1 TaxID=3064538 RepID=UPI0027408D39|nr:NADP-dependent oxidoreductase [Actinoplanes sp. RD1]
MTTMKAVVATDYGPPEQLTIAELPVPRPGPGQLQVRVAAASINPPDTYAITGAFGRVLEFPFVPGTDLAGTVTEAGPGVTAYRPGDEVFGHALPRSLRAATAGVARPSLSTGALAEYVVLEADTPMLAHRPPSVPADHAAALVIPGMTALVLRAVAALQPGEKVLVIGATGATGLTTLPLLAAAKADITATAATEAGADLLRGLGADRIIGHDPDGYPGGVDVVLNLVLPADRLPVAARTLRPGGRFVSIVFPPPELAQLGRDDVELHFVMDLDGKHGGMAGVAEGAASGELATPIARRYRLDEGVRAVLDHARRHPLGKIVVLP